MMPPHGTSTTRKKRGTERGTRSSGVRCPRRILGKDRRRVWSRRDASPYGCGTNQNRRVGAAQSFGARYFAHSNTARIRWRTRLAVSGFGLPRQGDRGRRHFEATSRCHGDARSQTRIHRTIRLRRARSRRNRRSSAAETIECVPQGRRAADGCGHGGFNLVSIIAQKWVLTAAHCIERGTKSGDVKAKAGATNYATLGTWAPLERIVVHERYNPETQENDLALLKLASPPSGKVIPLADAGMTVPVGQPLEVTGWGAASEGGDAERNLLQGTVPYVDNDVCNASGSYNGSIGAGMMCAGHRDGGVDACQGDSGGPLVWKTEDGPILVGVVSFGEGCARKLKYGVYTRVSNYRDWITKIIAADR